MAEWHVGRGHDEAAEAAYDTALEGFVGLGDVVHAATTRHALGLLHHRTGRDEEADTLLARAAEDFDQIGATHQAAVSTQARARLAEERGETDAAARLYREALDRYARVQAEGRVDEAQGMADCLVPLGLLQHRAGHDDEALASLEVVLREATSRQGLSTFFSGGQAPTPLELPDLEAAVSTYAGLLQQAGRLEDARACLRDVLRLREVREDPRLNGLVHHELGGLAAQLDDPTDAIAQFAAARESLVSRTASDDGVSRTASDDDDAKTAGASGDSDPVEDVGGPGVAETLAESEYNLGLLLAQSGETDEGLELARSAQVRFAAIDNRVMAAEAVNLEATTLLHAQRLSESATAYRRAAELLEDAGDPEGAARARAAADSVESESVPSAVAGVSGAEGDQRAEGE